MGLKRICLWLSLGLIITLPAYDKTGSPIRKHEKDCAATGPCQCELVMVEKVLLPNPQVLMWTMDRADPQPREPEAEAPHSSTPELTRAEQIAEASKYFDLFRAGIQTLLDLGVPLPAIAASARAIETSATKVQPEPVSEQMSSQTTSVVAEPAMPADPSDKPPEAF